MAADTCITNGNSRSHTKKLARTKVGIVGLAGVVSRFSGLIAWLNGDRKTKPNLDGVSALLLTPTGILFYDNNVEPVRLRDAFAAIGSGEQAAFGAMYMGASPVRAVQIAIRIDPNSDGPVTSLALDQSVRRARARTAARR